MSEVTTSRFRPDRMTTLTLATITAAFCCGVLVGISGMMSAAPLTCPALADEIGLMIQLDALRNPSVTPA